MESYQLPPSKDCFQKHVQRANYQAALWRRCLEAQPDVPSPVEHGWKLDPEDGLLVKWMDGQPAPEAVLDLLSCKCTRRCVLPRCVCMVNGLKCTNLCKLQECDNQTDHANEELLENEIDDLTNDFDDF